MNTEQILINTIQEGIKEAVKARLNGYDSPIKKLIDSVVSSREQQFRNLMEEAIDESLSDSLRQSIKEAVSHKIARIMVSKMEGEVEKRTNELRSSPETRAKITLAIDKALKEVS